MQTTKPNEQKHLPSGDFTWEQFAKDCVLNKYILVVGSEAVLNKTHKPFANGNSSEFLFDCTLRQFAETIREEDEEATDEMVEDEYERLKKRYKTYSALVRKYGKNVKQKVRDVISGPDFTTIHIDAVEPELKQLLSTRCFRIVLTTTIDPLVEFVMKEIWGEDGFDIVDINNIKELFKSKSHEELGEVRPTLCYVFGKVDPTKKSAENSFVLSENDAMEKISKWFERSADNRFLQYIRKFRILSVGNQFDDWMFRFFWFLLRGKVNAEADGQVAVEIKDDSVLEKYMKHENVELFPDARVFMHAAFEQITNALDVSNFPGRGDDVFISYAHEDKYIAVPLYERLHEEGVNVWIDEQGLRPGDEYERILIKKINNCKVFLPILSSSIMRQLESGEAEKRWYYKEWSHMQNRCKDLSNIEKDDKRGFKIIPFVIGDFKVDTKTCQCIDSTTKFEMAKETIESLIARINK